MTHVKAKLRFYDKIRVREATTLRFNEDWRPLPRMRSLRLQGI